MTIDKIKASGLTLVAYLSRRRFSFIDAIVWGAAIGVADKIEDGLTATAVWFGILFVGSVISVTISTKMWPKDFWQS